MKGICTVPECGKPRKYRGWCGTHYERWRKHGDVTRGYAPKKTGCLVDRCEGEHYARGWCGKHYSRWVTRGDPMAEVNEPGQARRYLESVVLKHSEDECLPWPFLRNESGYAIMSNGDGSRIVSRIVCEKIHGEPPTEQHEGRHLCGKGHEGCCAPKHLAWGTPHENQMDRVVHGTHIRGERHPLHKLTEFQAREALRLKGVVSQYVLAEMFGVTRATISHVQNRTTWAWL